MAVDLSACRCQGLLRMPASARQCPAILSSTANRCSCSEGSLGMFARMYASSVLAVIAASDRRLLVSLASCGPNTFLVLWETHGWQALYNCLHRCTQLLEVSRRLFVSSVSFRSELLQELGELFSKFAKPIHSIIVVSLPLGSGLLAKCRSSGRRTLWPVSATGKQRRSVMVAAAVGRGNPLDRSRCR